MKKKQVGDETYKEKLDSFIKESEEKLENLCFPNINNIYTQEGGGGQYTCIV